MTNKVEVWGEPPQKAKPGIGLLPPTPKPTTQTNKRQNSWTLPKRSNKCFRCGIKGHYIARCPFLRQDSYNRYGSRGHTYRDCVPIQRGYMLDRTGRTGQHWRQVRNRLRSQLQSKSQQAEQTYQAPQQRPVEETTITQPTGGEWNKEGIEWVAPTPALPITDWGAERSVNSEW